jgi:Putative zinc-finger
MSEQFQNDPNARKKGHSPARKLSCEEWEAMLVDYLDGALASGEPENFHAHRETCAACAEMFTHAGQGREWLNFLRMEPEAPAALVSRILAQTSGAEARPGIGEDLVPAAAVAVPAAPVLPFWKRAGLAFAGRQVAQPRLLMTAAMAFFSITLTLNMAGVRLSTVRVADLKPMALGTNLNKQFHMASARVVRYYDNLRLVYKMEAQVREMRRNADLDNGVPAAKPEQSTPAATPQDPARKGGKSQGPDPANPNQHSARLWGEQVDAALRNPLGESPASAGSPITQREMKRQHIDGGIETTDSRAADQSERGIA